MQRLTDGGRRFIDHVSKGIGYALENGKKNVQGYGERVGDWNESLRELAQKHSLKDLLC